MWCLCAIDIDTGIEYRDTLAFPEDVISWLSKAELLVGHDIQRFDLPVMKKLYGFDYKGSVLDTKLMARCIYPDIKMDDWRSAASGSPFKELPSKMRGRHTLEAWGLRVGVHKDTTSVDRKNLDVFDPKIVDYCMQDCRVTLAVYKHLVAQKPSERMLRLEHEFAKIMDQQEITGFCFNLEAAQKLTAELQIKRVILDDILKGLFPPRIVKYLTEKKKLEREKVIIFNPASRDHVAWNLTNKYGWEPKVFTEEGKPKVDEKVLSSLDYPEAKQLSEYFLLVKRLGQISEGDKSWIKLLADDGKIHGGVDTNGTVTGRCAHVNPNLGQVPKVSNPYGVECRSLFIPSPGWFLVGCDASGLQLRLLAHYMFPYDKGKEIEIVTRGDIHDSNRQAFGIHSRDKAKNGIYALLFGAGVEKFSKTIGVDRQEGDRILRGFFRAKPAFKRLRDDIRKILTLRKTLRGLDGRSYPIRQPYRGLNTLLMGAEAVVMKQAVIYAHDICAKKGLVHGVDYRQVAMVHDEIQYEAKDLQTAQRVGESAKDAIELSGSEFGVTCPLTGKWRVGNSWAETH